MEIDWNSYLKSQKYSECQLVTVLNARYYLTGEVIKQDSQEYEDLVELCGARYGSAICIEKVYERLNLVIKKHHFGLIEDGADLPIDISIWHKAYGFHSVCAVDYEPRTRAFRIPNFKWATNLDGWIFGEDLNNFTRLNPDKTEPRYICRTLEVKDEGTNT